MKILRNMLGRTKALIGVFALLCLQNAYAIDAGQYYYYISEKCVPKGPQEPKARAAVTPDLWLFEVSPAGISDYYVHMNTEALNQYTDEGKSYLAELEAEQAYNAGHASEQGTGVTHNFMLQREAIGLTELIDILSGFSQHQKEKGYYFRKILSLDNQNARFKAVTKVQLVDVGMEDKMFVAGYVSTYYLLDSKGKPDTDAFISVDHKNALSEAIHPYKSPFNQYTKNGICGERWVP